MTVKQLAIKLPFQIDQTGGIATIIDPVILAAQEIKTVLLTLAGERLMRPEIGSPFNTHIFSPLGAADMELQIDLLLDSLQKQCILSTIQTATFTPNANDGVATFNVSYIPRGDFQTVVTTVTL